MIEEEEEVAEDTADEDETYVINRCSLIDTISRNQMPEETLANKSQGRNAAANNILSTKPCHSMTSTRRRKP